MDNIRKYLLIFLIVIQIIVIFLLYFKPNYLSTVELFHPHMSGDSQEKPVNNLNANCIIPDNPEELPIGVKAINFNPDGTLSAFKASCYFKYNLQKKDNKFKLKLMAGYPKIISSSDNSIGEFGKGIPHDIDDMVEIKGMLYIFKDEKIWKIDYFTKNICEGWENGKSIQSQWPLIPSNIDGAYYYNDNLCVFKGRMINKLSNNIDLFTNCPENIDTCFINEYHYNLKDTNTQSRPHLYVFKDNRFYIINLNNNAVDSRYPKGISLQFFNVPNNNNLIVHKFLAQDQLYTIPENGMYRFISYGAGAGFGGLGSKMVADFSLNSGVVINIRTGGKGNTRCDLLTESTSCSASASDSKRNLKAQKYLESGSSPGWQQSSLVFEDTNIDTLHSVSGGGATEIIKQETDNTYSTLMISGGGGGMSNANYTVPHSCHSHIPDYKNNKFRSDKLNAGSSINARYIILTNKNKKVILNGIEVFDSNDNNIANYNLNPGIRIITGRGTHIKGDHMGKEGYPIVNSKIYKGIDGEYICDVTTDFKKCINRPTLKGGPYTEPITKKFRELSLTTNINKCLSACEAYATETGKDICCSALKHEYDFKESKASNRERYLGSMYHNSDMKNIYYNCNAFELGKGENQSSGLIDSKWRNTIQHGDFLSQLGADDYLNQSDYRASINYDKTSLAPQTTVPLMDDTFRAVGVKHQSSMCRKENPMKLVTDNLKITSKADPNGQESFIQIDLVHIINSTLML